MKTAQRRKKENNLLRSKYAATIRSAELVNGEPDGSGVEEPQDDSDNLIWSRCKEQPHAHYASLRIWESRDGLYRISRAVSKYDREERPYYIAEKKTKMWDGMKWDFIEWDRSSGRGMRHRYLQDALSAVLGYHLAQIDKSNVENNHEDVLAAEDKRLNREAALLAKELAGSLDTTETEREKVIMHVNEQAARKMCAAMGWKMALEWPEKKLIAALTDLAERAVSAEELPDGEDKVLRDRIIKARQEGETIELEESEGDVKTEKAKAKGEKAGKSKAKAKAVNGKTSPKKSEEAKVSRTVNGARNIGDKEKLDEFGSPTGSSNAKVNKALMKSDKPLSFSELVAKSGLTPKQVRYAHLHSLVKAGHVKKTEDGWVAK